VLAPNYSTKLLGGLVVDVSRNLHEARGAIAQDGRYIAPPVLIASSEVSVGSFHELSGHCSYKQQHCTIAEFI